MRMRRRQGWTLKKFSGPVVVEPAFSGFEARNDRVTCMIMVLRRVLVWRGVAATDMSAFGTAAQMEPPALGRQTLDAARSTRLRFRIDTIFLNGTHWAGLPNSPTISPLARVFERAMKRNVA